MKFEIAIIGGGISGITTALTLQLMGFETTCYSANFVNSKTPDDPKFASLYPAASIIPHSVFSDQSEKLFADSQQVFRFLYTRKVQSIKEHQHYELFEFQKESPAYAPCLDNFERIAYLHQSQRPIPSRKNVPMLQGWMFSCMLAEWPSYISQLYRWYKKRGGKLIQQKIRPENIPSLSANIIINCAGIWSSELFDDPAPLQVVKGHLLYINDASLIKEAANSTIPSYNYTPQQSVYSDSQGNPTDVYCYPRSTGWAMGGSRQKGIINKSGEFKGAENEETLDIDGVAIPTQIYELNREILLKTYGLDIGQYSSLKAAFGYRFIRKEKGNGLRLESSEKYGKTIIHNYGHGGAGVALSWGCALQVAQRIMNCNLSDLIKSLNRFLKS